MLADCADNVAGPVLKLLRWATIIKSAINSEKLTETRVRKIWPSVKMSSNRGGLVFETIKVPKQENINKEH